MLVCNFTVKHFMLTLKKEEINKNKILPGYYEKVPSDKKTIFISHQRYTGGNRDYCSHFSVTFETTSKFLIMFLRLILGKNGVDGVTGPRREIDIRYEFDLKIIVKGLGSK